ncbi:MAG: hypothetical protein ACI85I_000571 [Arenicella sp.]|jgi:hypothetical protein
MTRQERLQFCRVCENRQNSDKGLICSITSEKADFDATCENFVMDEKAYAQRKAREE